MKRLLVIPALLTLATAGCSVLLLYLCAGASAKAARACPEDAMKVGRGLCVSADDFGVCRVMQAWPQQVYGERSYRRPVEIALVFEGRDLVCTRQRDNLGRLLH